MRAVGGVGVPVAGGTEVSALGEVEAPLVGVLGVVGGVEVSTFG
ncbi:hypothetical protein [Kribbella hippodromi]